MADRYRYSVGDKRFNRGGKHWTAEEVNLMLDLRDTGHTLRQIGFVLDRSFVSVQRRLARALRA